MKKEKKSRMHCVWVDDNPNSAARLYKDLQQSFERLKKKIDAA